MDVASPSSYLETFSSCDNTVDGFGNLRSSLETVRHRLESNVLFYSTVCVLGANIFQIMDRAKDAIHYFDFSNFVIPSSC
jgi:hypothetical protein